MSYSENILVQFETVKCCKCGVWFGMEQNHQSKRIDDGQGFYCPNGHCQSYSESTQKKLEKAQAELSRMNSQLALERDQKAAAEAARDKLRKRISKGVCPCCKRTVSQLAAHMKTKHPTYPK